MGVYKDLMIDEAIVLFDGECTLCNRAVVFISKRDPSGFHKFAALQSSAGGGLLKKYNLPQDNSTLVLVYKGRAYCRSTAALHIARKLRWPWPLLFIALLVPTVVRDAVYRIIAQYRFEWFPAPTSCVLPHSNADRTDTDATSP